MFLHQKYKEERSYYYQLERKEYYYSSSELLEYIFQVNLMMMDIMASMKVDITKSKVMVYHRI